MLRYYLSHSVSHRMLLRHQRKCKTPGPKERAALISELCRLRHHWPEVTIRGESEVDTSSIHALTSPFHECTSPRNERLAVMVGRLPYLTRLVSLHFSKKWLISSFRNARNSSSKEPSVTLIDCR